MDKPAQCKGCSSEKEYMGRRSRKAYATPRLIVHGTLEDITKGVQEAPGDGPTGSTPP